MKILVLANNLLGLYSFRKEVMKAFVDRGDEVYISAPLDDKAADVEKLGCKTIATEFNRQGTNPIADLKLMWLYRKLIKQTKADVVLTYTIKPNLYGGMACALTGVPQIANVTGLGAAVEYPGLMQKITMLLYKIGLRKTWLTFFQNKDNMQFCQEHGMVKGAVQLIPGSGVNLQYHAKMPYPAETEPVRFLFMGRIRREKGIEEFLAAAESITKRYKNVEFHVVGGCEGDYEGRLLDMQSKGVVTYHGRQLDVRPFIAKAACTLHPSFYPEGMSNVLLESCSTGRPIITTNRAGCREIIEDGRNGFLVKQQDADDLTAKVEKFIALPYAERKAMGDAAREKVEREFDRQIVIDAYLNAVSEIEKQ
jgi:galacturonosyltransferase